MLKRQQKYKACSCKTIISYSQLQLMKISDKIGSDSANRLSNKLPTHIPGVLLVAMSKYKNSRLRNELCRGGGWGGGGGGGEISKRGRGGETFLGIWPRGWRNHAGGGEGGPKSLGRRLLMYAPPPYEKSWLCACTRTHLNTSIKT